MLDLAGPLKVEDRFNDVSTKPDDTDVVARVCKPRTKRRTRFESSMMHTARCALGQRLDQIVHN